MSGLFGSICWHSTIVISVATSGLIGSVDAMQRRVPTSIDDFRSNRVARSSAHPGKFGQRSPLFRLWGHLYHLVTWLSYSLRDMYMGTLVSLFLSR